MIAEQQLQILKQITALPMSLAETQSIKTLVDIIDSLLKEWIILDRDLKGDEYALKKMLVFFYALTLANIRRDIFNGFNEFSFLGGKRSTNE